MDDSKRPRLYRGGRGRRLCVCGGRRSDNCHRAVFAFLVRQDVRRELVQMRRLLAGAVLLLSFVCLALPQDAEAANWVWVTSTDYATISLDSSSIRKYKGKIIFWDSWRYIDSERRDREIEETTKDYQAIGQDIDFSDLRSTTNRLYVYQAQDGTIYYRLADTIFYNSRGEEITSVNVPENVIMSGKWKIAPPGSIIEKEYQKVLSYLH